MKKLILLSVLSLNTAYALLPPLWESVAQIKAVLSDEHLKDYLESGEVIESIDRSDEGYTIKTNHSELKAIIQAVPQTMPGPAKYKVHFVK